MIALLWALAAHGNGQTTHLWISDHALSHLPAGELRDLLTRPDLRVMLDNGTMFPDGGYGVGDGYGELAHWEPIQTPYLAWIRDTYAAPWTDEAAAHIAFVMGLGSHGMADQVFDALYMARAKVYDDGSDWASLSMDEATDVVYAARVGAWDPPADWVPHAPLVDLFRDEGGHAVSADTLDSGQTALRIAIAYVAAAASQPEYVTDYEAQFPWATAHLEDDIPGAPLCEGAVIARYWQTLWARLHDRPLADPVLATWPTDGGFGHVRWAGDIEATVSVALARGLDAGALGPDAFSLTRDDGTAVPFEVRLFYGHASHVVHLEPTEDLAPDADYTLAVLPGLQTFDGEVLGGSATVGFSTRPPPAGGVSEEPGGCGCAAMGAPSALWPAGLLVLGLARTRRRAAIHRPPPPGGSRAHCCPDPARDRGRL